MREVSHERVRPHSSSCLPRGGAERALKYPARAWGGEGGSEGETAVEEEGEVGREHEGGGTRGRVGGCGVGAGLEREGGRCTVLERMRVCLSVCTYAIKAWPQRAKIAAPPVRVLNTLLQTWFRFRSIVTTFSRECTLLEGEHSSIHSTRGPTAAPHVHVPPPACLVPPASCLLHHSPIHLPYWSPNLAAFGDAYRWLTSAVTSTSDRTATSDPINGSFIACAPYPAACVLPALSLRSPCTALCTTLRTILVHDLPHNEMGGHETAQPPATSCAQVTTCRRTRSLLPPQATVLPPQTSPLRSSWTTPHRCARW